MLGKVADFYDDQVNVAVDTLTSLIEPMLIVLLGLGVGALVISMYLPIFRLAGTVAG
jgi:type IV pilus assembly protein PilC